MKEPVVLYSIQSYLAYYINTKYYGDNHYVWCAPFFDSNSEAKLMPKLPYTSNPIDIFKSYYRDIHVRDKHFEGPEIKRNTVGLISGATKMLQKGVINEATYKKIEEEINTCLEDVRNFEYFRPLIYVIPFELNKELIEEVAINKKAGALSPEYIIEALPTGNFSVIDLGEEGIK